MLFSETQMFLDTLFTHGLCVPSKVEEGMPSSSVLLQKGLIPHRLPMIRSQKVGPRRTFSSHCSKCSIIHRYIVFRNDFNLIVFGTRIGCFTLDSKLHEDSVLMNSTSFQKKHIVSNHGNVYMTIANCWELQTCQLLIFFLLVRLVCLNDIKKNRVIWNLLFSLTLLLTWALIAFT